MIRQIREISIAVRSLDEALARFRQTLGLEPAETQVHPRPPVEARTATFRVGDVCLALMESTRPGSPVDRFVQRRGEGLFSVSLAVDDLAAATAQLRRQGVELVLETPLVFENFRTFDGTYRRVKMNFTRPQSLHGVVFELQELEEGSAE
jgi:methylmalonyl-CoA epimerase